MKKFILPAMLALLTTGCVVEPAGQRWGHHDRWHAEYNDGGHDHDHDHDGWRR